MIEGPQAVVVARGAGLLGPMGCGGGRRRNIGNGTGAGDRASEGVGVGSGDG